MEKEKKRGVIIPAGGSGSRMSVSMPKQFLVVDGLPIIMHTINRFRACYRDIEVVVVLPEKHLELWNELCREHAYIEPHIAVVGGRERFFSVRNGLQAMPRDVQIVGVHDAVRPLVSDATIKRAFEAAEQCGAAIPVVTPVDTIRIVDAAQSSTLPRRSLRIVQTPQCFDRDLLASAYEQEYNLDFTDDASVVESLGHEVKLVEGNDENIKITYPKDLALFRLLYTTTL